MRYSGDCGERVPWRVVLTLGMILIVLSSKLAVHPWSPRSSTERRKHAGNWGKMCALRAADGRWGTLRSRVWEDWIMLPSGISTHIGLMAILLLVCNVVMEI